MEKILKILNKFQLGGEVCECVAYGNGHINGTYKVICNTADGEKRYILQSINKNVFKKPQEVMKNIEKVTDYLRSVSRNPREVLSLLKTLDGGIYYRDDDDNFWRVYNFVDDSICLEAPNLEEFYECALAFGKFQKRLTNFPADTLYETIPDFHNTPKRYETFLKAVEENKSARANSVENEINFVKERKDFYSVLIESNEKGELPLRVSHNDTKSNNVMLDAKTHTALCVIDLDTIMPGFSVTDFGDAIRFGASTAAEDEKDLNKVKLDLEKFEIYTKGFLTGCGGKLPDSEIMLLPEGAKMMTIECGMRFLTDYLDGDTYFKTEYPEHNLDRCHTQFKLVEEMEEHWDEMKEIVKKYCKN